MNQLLKVNMFPSRIQNSRSDFIFNDIKSDGIVGTKDILNLSKWIGKKPYTIEDIKNNTDNVLNSTIVKYKVYYTDDTIFTNRAFQLNKWGSMKVIIDSLAVKYKEHYRTGWHPFNKIPKFNNTYFEKDPVFAERLVISNYSKITLIGDIHSSLHSLLDIIYDLREKGYFKNDLFELADNHYIIFLGDIVDRGPYSVELLLLVFILKNTNFNQVYIINGNHEDKETYEYYDFKKETINQLGDHHVELEKILYFLPSVIYLKLNDKLYHLSHGALPEQNSIEGIKLFLNSKKDEESLELPKFYLISDYDPENSLKWGDFKISNGYEEGNQENSGRPQFGYDIVNSYCINLGITNLITGHQDLKPLLIMPRYSKVKSNYNSAIIYVGRYGNKFLKHDLKDHYSNIEDIESEDIQVVREEDTELIFSFDDDEQDSDFGFYEIETPIYKYKSFCDTDDNNDGYDLYGICKKQRFTMDPEDFLALTTSTATVSKGISHNTYLELIYEE